MLTVVVVTGLHVFVKTREAAHLKLMNLMCTNSNLKKLIDEKCFTRRNCRCRRSHCSILPLARGEGRIDLLEPPSEGGKKRTLAD